MRSDTAAGWKFENRPGTDRPGLNESFTALSMRGDARLLLGMTEATSFNLEHGPMSDSLRNSSIANGSTLSANVMPTPSGLSFVGTAYPKPDVMYSMLSAMTENRAKSHPFYQHPLSADGSDATEGADEVFIYNLTNAKDNSREPYGPYLPKSTNITHEWRPQDSGLAEDAPTFKIKLDAPPEYDEEFESVVSHATISTVGPDGRTLKETKLHSIHFPHWPDCDVPKEPEKLLKLTNTLLSTRESKPDAQTWVHCMAGAGRTGSLITLASVLAESKNPESSSAVRTTTERKADLLPPSPYLNDRVDLTADSLRDYRCRQILTPTQLALVKDIVDATEGVSWPSRTSENAAVKGGSRDSHASCATAAHSHGPSRDSRAPAVTA